MADNPMHFGAVSIRCRWAGLTSSFITDDEDKVTCKECAQLMASEVERRLSLVADREVQVCSQCDGVGWFGDEVRWDNVCDHCGGTGNDPGEARYGDDEIVIVGGYHG